MQNLVFIFIRNVLGIKNNHALHMSSITTTKHSGTELRVIGRRGRRAGGQAAATGHTEATRRRSTLQQTQDLFLFGFFVF